MIGSVMQFAAIVILLGIDSVLDIKFREIPNWISVAVTFSAIFNFNSENLWGLIVAAIFFFVALFTGKIGGGDVKLIAALSMVCGLWSSFALLLFAQISMLIFYGVSVIVQKLRGRTADKSLPFVPFIFIGYLVMKIFF
ncbi:MAG: A24 family peptidase [Oscillospiraceae bacterium]|nr:A24 family peptidase [Oscillospiraceae bacterium]